MWKCENGRIQQINNLSKADVEDIVPGFDLQCRPSLLERDKSLPAGKQG